MADSLATGSVSLRTHFAERAVLPERQLNEANKFLDVLDQRMAGGQTPTPADVKTGQKILDQLAPSVEVFAFNAAILAGQEAGDPQDLEARVNAISASLESAQMTTERLRQTLQKISA